MVGYVSFVEQADRDFVWARRRALWGRFAAWLRGDVEAARLRSFEEARTARRAESRIYLGQRMVETSKIVGSVGRHADFDRDFMPLKESLGERWKRLYIALYRGEELPPVELYRIGGEHFVFDGNHRVSVARFRGAEMIEAEVTEFRPAMFRPAQKPERGGTPEVVA